MLTPHREQTGDPRPRHPIDHNSRYQRPKSHHFKPPTQSPPAITHLNLCSPLAAHPRPHPPLRRSDRRSGPHHSLPPVATSKDQRRCLGPNHFNKHRHQINPRLYPPPSLPPPPHRHPIHPHPPCLQPHKPPRTPPKTSHRSLTQAPTTSHHI